MVSVKDGEVWADDSGGDGLPLVLLHPGVGDSSVWDKVMPRLVRRHRVIRYDARGYGRSPRRRRSSRSRRTCPLSSTTST